MGTIYHYLLIFTQYKPPTWPPTDEICTIKTENQWSMEKCFKENTNVQSFHNLLPIPQRERNLNSKLTQNTGY